MFIQPDIIYLAKVKIVFLIDTRKLPSEINCSLFIAVMMNMYVYM